MMTRLESIIQSFEALPDVTITSSFKEEGDLVVGQVAISVPGDVVKFDVHIVPTYPMQFQGMDAIRFVNQELFAYKHVNADGSVCIHSPHCPDLHKKIALDVNGVKEWMKVYYLGDKQDTHYEHIIVPIIDYTVFLFTEVGYNFTKGEFGLFGYSKLSQHEKDGKIINTHVVQDFEFGTEKTECKWSTYYKKMSRQGKGLYYFMEVPPVENKRFAVKNWNELEPFVSQEFLNHMYKVGRNQKPVPILFGYRIPNGEVHWIVATIPDGKFPNYGEKISGTKEYLSRLGNTTISWAQTRNSSYQYFFGRGAFPTEMTEKVILIIGAGAIGSMVASTLVRGGCRLIALNDFDLKEPENVCRSEYSFSTGVVEKIDELESTLTKVSPFVEVVKSKGFLDVAKMALNSGELENSVMRELEKAAMIFDCSTDNDVAYILDKLEKPEQIFTLSVTNLAQELICAVPPNLYKWMNTMTEHLDKGVVQWYNPTGCWNPTFKASYNDIASLVQFALRHIAYSVENKIPHRSFYLSTSFDKGFNIKLNEF